LQQRFAEADLFVFTSLRDTFGTVNLEALAKGCPVMCLNHQGVGTHLPDAVAIRVPVTTPEAVVHAMAIPHRTALNPELRKAVTLPPPRESAAQGAARGRRRRATGA